MKRTEFNLAQPTFAEARPAIEAVRRRVFIEEQQVPEELEWDGQDEHARHLLVTAGDGTPVATARLLPEGHIGRMAVLPAWRGQGVGAAMLRRLLEMAREQHLSRVFLNAQLGAEGFYAKAGFHSEGETFMDAGIPHKRMVLELARID
ncbi:GNAT family N-acetyltransferase [Thiohalophilus thiocyanatoxydans]|uniref:Putative GNAT family N-acyltransferase n=1 Tax=Thiohalophilus thiocyanatoxydans TaxID=381308 RepID=A0A4R8IPE0_9GAMM|nr:GNAT family N-acetyltransferase [Thiohalophilus thiocyanatoxydans]TDY02776.1 putative GNAT family N-acyltransferase [Thiohalophilus thiocyanatoxydans]